RVIITVTDDSPRSHTSAESGSTARLLLDSRRVVYAMVTKGPKPSRERQSTPAAAQGALYGMGNPVSILTQVLTKLASEALMDSILKDRAFGQMIQKTGGEAVKIDGEHATEKLALLLDHIANRYVVGIAAPGANASSVSTPTQDGFHTLRVKLTPEALKRHGELSIVTLQGYYARVPGPDPGDINNVVKPDPKKPR